MAEYKGYDLFDDVEDDVIRVWNQSTTFLNIYGRHGKELAVEYLQQLSKADNLKTQFMIASIDKKGMETVRKEIQKRVIEVTDEQE